MGVWREVDSIPRLTAGLQLLPTACQPMCHDTANRHVFDAIRWQPGPADGQSHQESED